MSIVGFRIRDNDGEEGMILREIGTVVFSVLMDSGEVRYISRGKGRFKVLRT